MAGHFLSHLTHRIPGEHFALIRPVRDDIRRSTVDDPRRGRRVRSRDRRKDVKAVKKVAIKQLKRDTHIGRPAKQPPARKMPLTAKSSPMGAKGVIAKKHFRPVHQQAKKAGVSTHRPRALRPHAPYAYHALPITRLGSIVRDRGLF